MKMRIKDYKGVIVASQLLPWDGTLMPCEGPPEPVTAIQEC